MVWMYDTDENRRAMEAKTSMLDVLIERRLRMAKLELQHCWSRKAGQQVCIGVETTKYLHHECRTSNVDRALTSISSLL